MLYRKRFYALAAAATVLVGGNGIALAKKGATCSTGGRFIATKSPLVATQVDAAGLFSVTMAVSATGTTLAIPGCTPAAVKLRGTAIKAKWTSCTGLTGKVRLIATAVKSCKRIKGTLSQSKGKPKRKHFATSLTTCGDGIVDSGNNELCDGNCGSGCDPSTCTCRGQTGGTGAFGIVTVNGKQKMYLPQDQVNAAGHGVVSVVNVGVAGNGVAGAPALITDIDLGTSDTATATGGDSLTVIAASTDNHTVWFIDPRTDQVIGTLTLDSSFGTSNFSGGGGVVTGIAIDSLKRQAILSVWNGFVLVDLRTESIVGTIAAPPSENFGFDDQKERIIAPFYDCSASSGTGTPPPCSLPQTPDGAPITGGVLVIDLTNANTIYTFQDPTAFDPTSPAGSEPDSAAADSSTGIIVTPEEGGTVHVIDLAQGVFAGTNVTAPQKLLDPTVHRLTGVAVEPMSHIAFLEGEASSNVGFLKVDSLATLASAITEATMPSLPDGSGFSNLFDPHGIAVTTGILNGGPVGFVVDGGRQWVARVDMAKVFTLSGPVLADADFATAVTYLDARTAAP